MSLSAAQRGVSARDSHRVPGWTPPLSSKEYPKWICKNSCGSVYPENTQLKKCPRCKAPLIRYRSYEER